MGASERGVAPKTTRNEISRISIKMFSTDLLLGARFVADHPLFVDPIKVAGANV